MECYHGGHLALALLSLLVLLLLLLFIPAVTTIAFYDKVSHKVEIYIVPIFSFTINEM